MKLLIMCEGPNELKIINILLENQKLKFTCSHALDTWNSRKYINTVIFG